MQLCSVATNDGRYLSDKGGLVGAKNAAAVSKAAAKKLFTLHKSRKSVATAMIVNAPREAVERVQKSKDKAKAAKKTEAKAARAAKKNAQAASGF